MISKIIGYGPKAYAEDSFNLFDCFVVIMSYVDVATSGTGSNLAIIKAFRLLRIFKLFKDWDAIKTLIATLSLSVKPIINLGVLMLLFNFISSLLLKNINGQPLHDFDGNLYPMGYNTTALAMLSNFIYMTGDNWCDLMNNSQDGFGNPIMYVIMIIIFTLGHFMLLNLFLCVLLRAMS
jgi:Ion transport protein